MIDTLGMLRSDVLSKSWHPYLFDLMHANNLLGSAPRSSQDNFRLTVAALLPSSQGAQTPFQKSLMDIRRVAADGKDGLEKMAKLRQAGAKAAHLFLKENREDSLNIYKIIAWIDGIRRTSWDAALGFFYHAVFHSSLGSQELSLFVDGLITLRNHLVRQEPSDRRERDLKCWKDVFVIVQESIWRRTGGDASVFSNFDQTVLDPEIKILVRSTGLVYQAHCKRIEDDELVRQLATLVYELETSIPFNSLEVKDIYLFALQGILQVMTLSEERSSTHSGKFRKIYSDLKLRIESALNKCEIEAAQKEKREPDGIFRDSLPQRYRLPFMAAYKDSLDSLFEKRPKNFQLANFLVSPDGLLLRPRQSIDLNALGDPLATEAREAYFCPEGFNVKGLIQWDDDGHIVYCVPTEEVTIPGYGVFQASHELRFMYGDHSGRVLQGVLSQPLHYQQGEQECILAPGTKVTWDKDGNSTEAEPQF